MQNLNAKRRARRTPQEGDQGYRTKPPPPPWKGEGRRGSSKGSKMPVPTSRNFTTCYMDLCKQQRLRPLPVISVTLPHSLNFATDRVKMDDWGPILNSLSLDQTLRSISIECRQPCRKPLEEVNSESKARSIGKSPIVLTRYLLEWLSHSVGQCVRNSSALTRLELEGIPLPSDCLAVLCVGLAATTSLQHFSLQRCHIGDNSCELICRTVVDVQSIRSLNLGQCDLTFHSGSILAAALSKQKLSLYHDTWMQSLRYREPNLEAMPGLRRLTLNGNPQLGDLAAIEVIEAVRDSLWMKALDFQNCGLTDHASREVLDLLEHNVTLAIVDVRTNDVSEEILKEIVDRLERNRGGASSDYQWITCVPRTEKRVAAMVKHRSMASRGEFVAEKNRSRSVIGRQPKRPCCQNPPQQKVLPVGRTSSGAKSRAVRVRPSCPKSSSVNISSEPSKSKSSEQPEKPTLRLDLQGQISAPNNDAEDRIELVGKETATVSIREVEDPEVRAEMRREMIRRLGDAKARQEQLVEETRRNYHLLAEERLRREVAEAKLRTARENLAELEAALKAKEEETRGFILVSQQSLDEICSAFERLLETLDSVTRNPRRDSDEEVTRRTIKQQIAVLIRKTKSEGLSHEAREHHDVDPHSSKLTKSETDLGSLLSAVSISRLERNIGDSPGVTSPSRKDGKSIDSPSARARAIFARILSEGFHVS